tara:strand:+ start:337 stop:2310 length:1974 start_codon:yes stop_codon:yes gene_type:complete
MDEKINSILNFIKKKNFIEAKKKCIEITKENQKNSEFFNIFAIILYQLNEHEESINKWEKAIKLNKKYFHAYNNLANAFLSLKKYDQALINFDKAIELDSQFYEAHHKKGDIYLNLKNFKKALESYNEVLKIKNDYIPTIKNKANLLIQLRMDREAIIELDKIILYEKESSSLYLKKGLLNFNLNNLEETLKNYKYAFKIDSETPYLLGNITHLNSKFCDWENYENDLMNIIYKTKKNQKVCPPYPATLLIDSPEIHLKISKIWIQDFENKKKNDHIFLKKKNNKIKIAYFSADFRTHAMGHLITRMLELHDKSKFELYGFYFGPKIDPEDKLQTRIIKCFDEFIDVSLLSDSEVNNLARKFNINIAIDLMGHTGPSNRFTIFIEKVAPIQISFLGFPGTTGSKCIDYLIADKILIPEKFQKFYSEKIIYLPDTYQPNEEMKFDYSHFKTKEDVGLPENKFIFCSFNGHRKITPELFKVWMKILKEKENSVLWLIKDNPISFKNLKKKALDFGINPDRLIFAEMLNQEEHLSRLKFADLFLDTFPYGAHTTCSNALRVNVPVITLIGDSFASRVCASILNLIKMDELITYNTEEYIKLALNISLNSNFLESLKNKMKRQINNSNLFRPEIFTKNLEKSYHEVYNNYLNGIEAKNIKL